MKAVKSEPVIGGVQGKVSMPGTAGNCHSMKWVLDGLCPGDASL